MTIILIKFNRYLLLVNFIADKLSGHKSWIQIEIGFLNIFAKKIAGIAWNIGELPKTKIASKTESSDQTLKDYNILSELVVLQTSMCKKIKNNLPVYTSETFDINDEKVICYSLVRNNTKKSKVVYHVWYMNGELKAKARIKVRPGKEIPAISNRKVNDLDIGKWKIVVTDVNKMILDTVIFEVV